MSQDLVKQYKNVKKSIVAIGFKPNENQITILGSGFIVDNDKIITAVHIYNQTPEEQRKILMANVMVGEIQDNVERYKWIPINLVDKDDKNDIVIFQLADTAEIISKGLKLGDSEKVQVGQEVYFIGFPYAAQLINDHFGLTLIVNKGIISNIKRDGVDPEHKRNWLIVDAISNPGNSGCPLIDAETGKVIGVMTIAFRTQSRTVKELDIKEPMHIAGAKPINLAKDILNKLSK
jgi:S1-C subfamily serine protease